MFAPNSEKPALQKLEMLWKALCQTAIVVETCSPPEVNIGYIITAPTASKKNVTSTTNFTTRPRSPTRSVASISPIALEPRIDRPLPTSIASIVPKIMIPSPPSCISASITACPKGVKSAPVLRTISPVTQVALVAVKSESMYSRWTSSTVAAGSISSPEPIRMKVTKLPISRTDGGMPVPASERFTLTPRRTSAISRYACVMMI